MVDIAIVGEAWEEKEEELGRPFVGPSGWMLDQLLGMAGIDRHECLVTNVFNLRPRPSNNVTNLCGKKAEGISWMPKLQQGKYVRKEYEPELVRLYKEIEIAKPNIIITLGATASWAFLHSSGIVGIRGACALSQPSDEGGHPGGYKVLPTYHPAVVTRQYTLRPIVAADLGKAKRESDHPEFIRPFRELWLEPTLDDLKEYYETHLKGSPLVSADIETKQNQITCIGFAPSPASAIIIPFFRYDGSNYWKTQEEEMIAWDYVRSWLAEFPTCYQNGLYDMRFLWNTYGIPVPKAQEDTMLLHHAWQPEMQKGLGFLGSIYTDEASWKFMGKGKRHD